MVTSLPDAKPTGVVNRHDLRARQIQAADFAAFDLMLVMTRDKLALVSQIFPPAQQHKVHSQDE